MKTQLRFRSGLGALALALALGACASQRGAGIDDDFERAGHPAPSVGTLRSMARVLSHQGRDSECEQVLIKLIETHPEVVESYNELTELYLRHGEVDAAERVLELGTQAMPEDPVLWNNLGMCQLFQKRYAAALVSFERSTALDPDDARARSNKATALALLGRFDEAHLEFLHVMPAVDTHHNLGVLAEARGDADRAAEEFAKAEELAAR